MAEQLGSLIGKLGFGFMRLPKRADGSFDMDQVKTMVDHFMEAGFTYFDTAYVYDDGASERALKESLIDRYPRESFVVATKMCAWQQAEDAEAAKQQFYTSLERTGAGYFDFYLLHALQAGNYQKYDEYGLWDFVRECKAEGLIRHIGFSFHAGPELLDELLSAHPEVEFVQLQINYADWENPDVTARANYEALASTVSRSPSWSPSRAARSPTPSRRCATSCRRLTPTLRSHRGPFDMQHRSRA